MTGKDEGRSSIRVDDVGRILLLTLVYLIAAKLGLMLDAVGGFATLVWPPTGIALAALVRFGTRLWPGVAIGAFAANLLTGASIPVALGIGVGNTLEAVAGTYALGRVAGFRGSFDGLREALALIAFAAVGSTTISATIGVTSLYLGGLLTATLFSDTWRAWWLGDLIGDLVVAPILLVWSIPRSEHDPPRHPLELLALAITVLAVSLVTYESPTGTEGASLVIRYGYVFFPPLMWAALRFGQRETIMATFAVAALAIVGTALGRGPFVRQSLHQGLFSLQTFVAVAGATFLVLGASISERRRSASQVQALISVASHELRTPLAALQLQVELIERTMAKHSEAAVVSLGSKFVVVRRQVSRLARLIDNLLDASRIAAHKLSLEYDEVDLSSTVRDVVSRFDEELHRAGSEMSLRAEGPVVGRWDRTRLDQIVTNLISNAVKYGAGNPIEVTVESSGDSARLVVADRGIGIAEGDRPRIFQRFERLSGTHAGGFGLGLWIVHESVDGMGGTIRVESALGKGTTFVIELPKTI
jgi:signal transduction histidine kinase